MARHTATAVIGPTNFFMGFIHVTMYHTALRITNAAQGITTKRYLSVCKSITLILTLKETTIISKAVPISAKRKKKSKFFLTYFHASPALPMAFLNHSSLRKRKPRGIHTAARSTTATTTYEYHDVAKGEMLMPVMALSTIEAQLLKLWIRGIFVASRLSVFSIKKR